MMHACCSMAFIEIKNEMSCIVYLKSFTCTQCTGYNEITGFTSKTINCEWKKLSKLAHKLHIK